MNTKRILFWSGFIIVLVLIVWGLIVAMNKPINNSGANPKNPAPISQTDNVRGPENAPVTLIEYSDFQCPACQSYYFVVDKLLASSTVPIRFVYRHFPLTQHANAIPASLASEAAGAQGKFWDMYKIIFENASEWTELSDAKPVFLKYAKDLGLDITKFETDIASDSLRDKINKQQQEGVKIGINGTPSFFVNGKFIDNPKSYAEFETIIKQAVPADTK